MSVAPTQKTFTCHLPPAGISNPSLPPDLENRIPRERIYLPAQEGYMCLFAAMDRIRLIMGNHPSVAENALRKREIVILQNRELFNSIVMQHVQNQQLADQLQSICKSTAISRAIAKSFIRQNENNLNLAHPEILVTLREFTDQEELDELSEFFSQEYLKKITEYTKQFMKNLFDNPEEASLVDPEIESVLQKLQSQGLSTYESAMYMTELKNLPLFDFAGLRESSWHPNHPIPSLITEIQQNGPLLVVGQFGQEFYSEELFELSQKIQTLVGGDVQERSLWGWRPGSARDDFTQRHAVLIVGANEEKKHIYFIDPLDPSDPNDPESQKIYVMSEGRFLSNLCPLVGFQSRDKQTGEPHFTEPAPEGEPNGYAVHGDPTVNYL